MSEYMLSQSAEGGSDGSMACLESRGGRTAVTESRELTMRAACRAGSGRRRTRHQTRRLSEGLLLFCAAKRNRVGCLRRACVPDGRVASPGVTPLARSALSGLGGKQSSVTKARPRTPSTGQGLVVVAARGQGSSLGPRRPEPDGCLHTWRGLRFCRGPVQLLVSVDELCSVSSRGGK